MIISVLISKSSPASAFLGSHFDEFELEGSEVLLRTKYDLDYHEEKYVYLTETVLESVESVDVTCEVKVPKEIGKYWRRSSWRE